ncbi:MULTISPECIES: ACT domain-containing protein [Sinorhizobium]|uniref:Transporter n=2 Tax=Sinorhizobium TaxID=28105 RepID=A0A2S3YMR8_9HYPH|nr:MULTISPECIES: ACT domain-containing protein [Sinorhizobium]AUX77033.1 ACT domain-containing protein [Sinorhizobium fredii]PDT42406.1 transporter [Sinorhizobium sp. FG01]PDT54483.1 transporter [Sinorhizobium sp. NG07B]POH30326.1 transporter [Sinorhizobium americanum]POH31534.1 transporter [Sinorhizobium americanum]
MSGDTDLRHLLGGMNPILGEGEYVYCTVEGDAAFWFALEPIGTFREVEGLTLILERSKADAARLSYGPVLRQITLSVHSALEAVGLTAAVSAALTRAGISANVVAAYYHDHIFVPAADAERALEALQELSRETNGIQ